MPQELTAEQARDLAQIFLDCGKKVADYRLANLTTLNEEERNRLALRQQRLLSASRELTMDSIEIDLADLQPVLQRITQTTQRLSGTIRKLARVNKVLATATAITNIAGALLLGNPIALISALDQADQLA